MMGLVGLFTHGPVARNVRGVFRVEKRGGVGELRTNVQNGVKNSLGSYRELSGVIGSYREFIIEVVV